MLGNMEFLVTGFSRKREKKLEDLIKKHGGTVLSDIPAPTNNGKRCKGFQSQAVPVVLCSKKVSHCLSAFILPFHFRSLA